MRNKPKIWKIIPSDTKASQQLQKELGVNQKICDILVSRNIGTFEKAKAFFRPNQEQLHSPFLFLQMQKSIDRIKAAIVADEHIIVFGDYDVDGTMAVSLVFGFFKKIYNNISFYIPNRYTEGYGLSLQGIDEAENRGAKLMIVLDCGIKENEKIDYANLKKIDVIICDHHEPSDVLPNAFSILNPKVQYETYPFKELSGCGIGFKLISAWCIDQGFDMAMAMKFIDLAAISTASDIVPVIDENRTILALGLEKINSKTNPVVNEILLISNFDHKVISVSDIVFGIGPRINAAGRMDDANKIIALFNETDAELIKTGVKILNNDNIERKDLDFAIKDEALELLENNPQEPQLCSNVLYNENWHKGVIGIVASRVIEHFYKPTIICTLSEGKIVCSARSVRDFNILKAIEGASEYLTTYGGHFYAAGLTLLPEKFSLFQEKFEQVVASTILPDMLIPKIIVDSELELKDITHTFFNIIEQMAPFGPDNMRPNFILKNVKLKKCFLLKDAHLKIEIGDGTHHLSGIGFNMKREFELIINQPAIDLVFQLVENIWQGIVSIECRIIDIRPAQG